jgi:hypothetical protein
LDDRQIALRARYAAQVEAEIERADHPMWRAYLKRELARLMAEIRELSTQPETVDQD